MTKTEAAHEVRKVLQGIKDHLAQPNRPKLSEADTRAHFIDPLLRALGYHEIGDVQHEVFIETAKQYLDYLLVVDALPRVAVEAKAVDVPFSDAHGAQVVQYSSVLGLEWAVVTNAREWRLYHGFEKGPLADKLLITADLLGWATDAQFNTVFEQLWLVSRQAFQLSDGPSAWLAAKRLDTLLRRSLADASSPEIKYLRKRLGDQAVAVSAEELATWFKMNINAIGSPSALPKAPSTPDHGSASLATGAAVAGQGSSPETGLHKTSYYRVMLGAGSAHADACHLGGFIGLDYGIAQDLGNELTDNWRPFNHKFIPIFQAANPGKSNVAAGLSCGALWTVSKGLRMGDVVLCPNGKGQYLVGRIAGGYEYAAGGVLPHRRPVSWLDVVIERSAMSQALRNSTGSIGAVGNITGHSEEIEQLLQGKAGAASG